MRHVRALESVLFEVMGLETTSGEEQDTDDGG
jgi:hypothetical protein